MFIEVDEVSLFRAVLSQHCDSDAVARQHLRDAKSRGIDPLDYASHQFGLGNTLVWRRAADWAGYRFADQLPNHPRLPRPTVDRLEHLSSTRTLRQDALDQTLSFVSPKFAAVLNLRRSRNVKLYESIRFAAPEAIEAGLARAASDQLMVYAQTETTRRWKGISASQLKRGARIGFTVALGLTILLVMLSGALARAVLVPIVALLLVPPGLLRLAATVPRQGRKCVRPLTDRELPTYSVFIPLRDEAQMVPLLKRAMSALEYPSHLLDIKFIVEAKSPETVHAVEDVLGEPQFRRVIVPQGLPATKPKAIDYALPLARGEFLVVYDAEDIPDPDQLRRAASLFRADPDLACLQAELVPDNARENILTALFAGEYAGLFGRFLPALARWGLPVPLGGTSNHFRTSVLRELGGWDAFNVTEDADLGVRLARHGYRAEAFTSVTREEAPLTLKAWMAQRVRWQKGWMQTYCVHAMTPGSLLRDLGWKSFLGFHLTVGGMIMSSLLHTVFLGTVLGRLLFDGVVGLIPLDIWDWLTVAILVTGYGGALTVVMSGLVHLRAWRLMPAQHLVPAYWVLHSIATLFAARELIIAPTAWSKTTHGVTRMARMGATAADLAKPRTG